MAELGSFHTASVEDRLGGLAGQPAEQAFERWQAARGRLLGERLWRYGFDQVTTQGGVFATFPSFLRHTPDYASVGGHLWEVEGSTGTWQVKQEKLAGLQVWYEQLAPTRQLRWFLYNSADDTAVVCTHGCLLAVCNEQPLVDELFAGEGKPGWLLTADMFDSRTVSGDPFQAEKQQVKVQGLVA